MYNECVLGRTWVYNENNILGKTLKLYDSVAPSEKEINNIYVHVTGEKKWDVYKIPIFYTGNKQTQSDATIVVFNKLFQKSCNSWFIRTWPGENIHFKDYFEKFQ